MNFQLLCACASTRPRLQRATAVADFVHEELNWDEFFRLAEHHGVSALVASNLLNNPPGGTLALTDETQESLRAVYTENLRRNLWFASELTRILDHLAEKRVQAIPYKGPVLAQAAYGDLGLRTFHDLDVLISPSQFGIAKRALAEAGFLPSEELASAVERFYLRTGYERSFDLPAAKNLLELQWSLLPFFYAVDFRTGDFQFPGLWKRSGRVQLGSTTVPCLSAEDSLLALCLHAAKHLWTRLIWIADIAETLHVPEIRLPATLDRARKMGIERIVGVNLWLARNLLQAKIPAEAEPLMSDPKVGALGQKYATRLESAAVYDFESADYFRQIWHLRERGKDRWLYLWRLLWTPGPGEVSKAQLPEALFPLYSLIRVGRLLPRLPRMSHYSSPEKR